MQHYISHPYGNHPKYTSIEIYGSQGIMLLYDITIILDSSECITNYGT
jgi:GTPase SAR1 family protein